MSVQGGYCPLCKKELVTDDIVGLNIGVKGAEGINNASPHRGDSTVVTGGTTVHKSCRVNYINKKDIEKHLQQRGMVDCQTTSIARSARLLIGSFDSKADCLFCGNEIVLSRISSAFDDYSCVKTENFVDKIVAKCKARGDEWSLSVQERIEYYCGELHAADCVCHHSCDANFRTGRDVPLNYRV